jgi:hypothetical protein
LLLPEGVTSESLSLSVRGETGAAGVSELAGRGMGKFLIAADGRFELGPLPVGQLHLGIGCIVSLGAGSATTMGGCSTTTWPINPNATTQALIDLRTTFPARILATIRIDDLAAGGGSFYAGLDDGVHYSATSMPVSPTGQGRAGPLAPNCPVQVAWIDRTGWVWIAPDMPSLAPGLEHALELSFETAPCEIQVLDAATSLPVSDLGLRFVGGVNPQEDLLHTLSRYDPLGKTDAAGKLVLRLPLGAGSFNVGATGSLSPASVSLNGSPIVLHLTRAP